MTRYTVTYTDAHVHFAFLSSISFSIFCLKMGFMAKPDSPFMQIPLFQINKSLHLLTQLLPIIST